MAGVRNDLQLSAKLDFEGNEPQGTCILSTVRLLSRDFFLTEVSTVRILCTICITYEQKKRTSIALHTYYTQQIKWTVTNMAQCNVRATIRLAMCGSRSLC
jgi:hypothetical protein